MIGRQGYPTERPGRRESLGLLPEIAIVGGVGLVFVSLANALGRVGFVVADVLFWLGIIAIVLPVALRLLHPGPDRVERIGLALVMGLGLYVVKMLHSPDAFTLHDELLHVRTVADIAGSGALFQYNPLLLVSPLYPGLEVVTAIVMNATGADAYAAGSVVVALARVLLVLGVFLLFEIASGDARTAGIASFVYMANPNFLYFDAQFAYESLAIALAVGVFYLTAASEGRWRAGAIAAVVLAGSVIVTHHITTYAMLAFLVLWSVISMLVRSSRREPNGPGPWRVTALAIVGALAWLFVVAVETLRYLAPRIADGFELVRLLLGDIAGRQPFQATTGEVAPLWERLVGYGAVILLLIALPFGLYRIWRDLRTRPLAIALGLAAMTYPATLALRLTARGAEEASRTSGFIFLGVGLVAALAITGAPGFVVRRRLRYGTALAAAGLVLLIGGSVVGTPRWARIPGPFLPAADTRSIERQNLDASAWILDAFGPRNRTVSDRTNRILLGSYGQQDPVTEYGDQLRSWSIFYEPTLTEEDRAMIRVGAIDFVVIDTRIAQRRPVTRVYFEAGEPLEVARAGGLTMEGLTKFGAVPGVHTVFDAGDIRIYDVRALQAGPVQ